MSLLSKLGHACLLLIAMPLLACGQLPRAAASRDVVADAVPRVLGPFPLVRVVDGDTLWIWREERIEKLRLLSVDTEERRWEASEGEATDVAGFDDQPHQATLFGEETALWATEFFQSLERAGKPPLLKLLLPPNGLERDAFGRLLCHVLLPDGTDFNLLLVQLGKSPYYNKYGPSWIAERAFQAAELEARRAQRGIWSPGNQARASAPDYARLRPWWTARAQALESHREHVLHDPEVLDAADGPGLARVWETLRSNPVRNVLVFGSIARFYEESNGSLTALLNSDAGEPLRLVLPKQLRGSQLEATLRQAKPKYRQNFLYLSGQLSLGERGLSLVATPDSQVYPAGPEPRPPDH